MGAGASTKETVSPSRRGSRDASASPVCSCAPLLSHCARDRGCKRAPGFPCALSQESGRNEEQNSDKSCRENASACFVVRTRSKLSVVPAKAGTHYPKCELLRDAGVTAFFNNTIRWLWVPAFAGTTAGDLARSVAQTTSASPAPAASPPQLLQPHPPSAPAAPPPTATPPPRSAAAGRRAGWSCARPCRWCARAAGS